MPTVWQLPQFAVDNGVMVCGFAPEVGRGVAFVPLWQVEQVVEDDMP